MNATELSPQQAQEALLRYLRASPDDRQPGGPAVRRAVKRLVPEPLRLPLRRLATDALAVRERRKARRLARHRPLLLHLGSGRTPKEGWVNVDLLGAPTDLAWNLERPLPFADSTVDAVFHEHLLEHLPLAAGLALTLDCHRVLRLGGVLRIGVPDAGAYAGSYVCGGVGFIESVRAGRPTPLLAMQEAYYWYGHRTMYDLETLALLCRAAGFTALERREFGESRLTPCPGSEHRRLETLYVEAVR